MRNKTLTIKVDIYDSIVKIIYTNDIIKTRDNLFKKHPHLGVFDANNTEALFECCTDHIGEYWILFPMEPSINTIVHEVSHACFRILTDHDVSCDIDNDEAFAYLSGYLAERIYNKK
jgi:hypothetical protein